jgi:signal transduction histidine kinase
LLECDPDPCKPADTPMNTGSPPSPGAERATRHRTDPLAIVAHELRTPVGAIRNALSILETAPALPGALLRAQQLIARQVEQLAVLIDDLLDVASAARGTLAVRRRSIDVVPEVQAAIESCAWRIDRSGHRLVTQLEPPSLIAYVDGVRLRQVIINLLDNACKYTQSAGCIALKLSTAEPHLVICVEDNGYGIRSDRLPYVFDLFSRGCEDEADAPPGLGVGLALVREIVALHDGVVEARSDGPGCGSAFIVRLPLKENPSRAHSLAP